MPSIRKLLFRPLPNELAEPIRTELNKRTILKRAIIERRKAKKEGTL